jgi:predicted Zn-ribbon and HTH transcriptional regulator
MPRVTYPEVTCSRPGCGQSWEPRVKHPAKCPFCGSRNWDNRPGN